MTTRVDTQDLSKLGARAQRFIESDVDAPTCMARYIDPIGHAVTKPCYVLCALGCVSLSYSFIVM